MIFITYLYDKYYLSGRHLNGHGKIAGSNFVKGDRL